MKKLVSIVIPVFNTDFKLIKKCLQSVKKQTYRNWETVIIDDGSSNELASLYDTLTEENIRVIHQKNMGVSVARNKGVEIAKGEFIIFLDADDYLTPTAIGRGVYLAEKENVDMVIGAVEKVTDICACNTNTLPDEETYTVLKSEKEYGELRAMCLNNTPDKYMNIAGKGEILRGPFARLMKAELAKETPFPVGIILGEDVIWNMRLLKKCNSICIDYNIWYNYVLNMDSAIYKYYGNRTELATDYLNLLLAENPEIKKEQKSDLVKNEAIEFYCILNYDWMSSKCPLSYKEKVEAARKLLKQPVWNTLDRGYLTSPISSIYKIFIMSVKCGIWPILLKIYNYLKRLK